MRSRKPILIGVGLCLVFGVGLTLILNKHWFTSPAVAYTIAVTCPTLPPDDGALKQWLHDHAGWRDVSVTRDAGKISIRFGTDQGPQPALFRELLAHCDRLGYEKRSSYDGSLVDRSQQGTNWHTFWVEYSALPDDDAAIGAWLAAQPNVSQSTVARDGKIVSFEFMLASPEPTILANITRKCGESGYQGQVGFVHAFGRYR
jgi:hypothetical protein